MVTARATQTQTSLYLNDSEVVEADPEILPIPEATIC